ncbi:hypothetical protein BDU57DRAFT_128671 [Ampelomyces quisqualis]|uniref:Uncharacterized protein n=1 Tax=Ampelomyces quisqualis TaxID=50730 RepID=A0A6A5QZ07_AMPQU|nr:hypothetical protein BDU57DRAFT_128671 [Ampelomyces quisqualis]
MSDAAGEPIEHRQENVLSNISLYPRPTSRPVAHSSRLSNPCAMPNATCSPSARQSHRFTNLLQTPAKPCPVTTLQKHTCVHACFTSTSNTRSLFPTPLSSCTIIHEKAHATNPHPALPQVTQNRSMSYVKKRRKNPTSQSSSPPLNSFLCEKQPTNQLTRPSKFLTPATQNSLPDSIQYPAAIYPFPKKP